MADETFGPGAVFLVTLGVLAVLFQPNTYLNDEMVQGLDLDALAHGHVWISARSPGYADHVRPLEGNIQIVGGGPEPLVYGHVFVPGPDSRGPPVGSNMVAVLGLPILGVLTALALFVGPRGAIVLPLAILAGVAGASLWRTRGATAKRSTIAGM